MKVDQLIDRNSYAEFFDVDYYNSQIAAVSSFDLEHFVTIGDSLDLDPGPYFSTKYYKSRYPDWRASGAKTALEDFLSHIASGDTHRQPHPLIEPAYYRSIHADLANLGHDAVMHFIRHGDAEKRHPSKEFDATFYARCYLPITETSPFRHYVTQGSALGYLPRPKPITQTASTRRMMKLTDGLKRPLAFAVHEAQKAGVPILTLDLADHAISRGWQPVFLLLRGGPLLPEFHDRGPVAILAEGWDMEGIANALPNSVPAIANTAMVAGLAQALANGGRSTLLLIQEMHQYLQDQDVIEALKSAQASGVMMAVPVRRMVSSFESELGTLPVLRPGVIRPRISISSYRRVLRRMDVAFDREPIFIGAGHADYRKGFDLFLSAAKAITLQRPGARFVWLGNLDHWAQDLADSAKAQGLNLSLPGFVQDAAAWYLIASAYLLTSRQDPGPTTVVHAALMGTPFVGYAADIGLIGELDSYGKFVPEGDQDAFVAAALDSMSLLHQDRRRLRRKLETEVSFESYAAEILAKIVPKAEDSS